MLTAHDLTGDPNHLYIVFLPKGVESCINRSNVSQGGRCNVGGTNQGGYCGYHSYAGSTIYAAFPYAIVDGPSGDTCSSDGGSLLDTSPVGSQAPNGNLDADTEVSVMSHEISESITDPNPGDSPSSWMDANQQEVGDDCAHIYGDSLNYRGTSGAEYNQTINGDHYFIQEEFSQTEFQNVNANYSCALNSQQTVLYAQWKPLAPLSPTKVVAKADVDSASITWSAPVLPADLSVTGYRVYVSLNSGAAAKQLYPGGVAVTGMSFKALHLRGGRTYYAHVIAIDSGGSSVASNYARVTISPASTSTSLKISKTKVSHTLTHTVVFSVHVMTSGSPDVPPGSVHVMSGSVTLCTIAISARSTGSCSTHHALAKGRHLIVAKFASSRSHRSSTSKSVALTIS
jgi:hypothetical protein